MVEDDKYCIDILTPVSAVTKASRPSRWACSTSTWRTACSTPHSSAATTAVTRDGRDVRRTAAQQARGWAAQRDGHRWLSRHVSCLVGTRMTAQMSVPSTQGQASRPVLNGALYSPEARLGHPAVHPRHLRSDRGSPGRPTVRENLLRRFAPCLTACLKGYLNA